MLTGDLLSRAARAGPTKTAIVAGDARVDYARLDADANRLAHALLGLGVGKGATAAIMAGNRAEYPAIHFGVARTGAVLAHLSVRYTADDIAYMLALTEVETVLVERPYLDLIREARRRLPLLTRVVAIGAGEDAPEDAIALEALLAGQPDSAPDVAIDEDDPYAITFTGGTTGRPKGVVVSHRARTTAALLAASEFGVGADDVVAVATPLFHSAGLFVWYQMAVALGCTAVLMPAWNAKAFADAVAREKITAVFLVPTQLNDLISDPGFDAGRLAGLAKINHAGAPMPPALSARLAEALPDAAISEHYGQSEACPLTFRPPQFNREKAASAGRPCAGVEIAVVDARGQAPAPGVPGEVVTRGPHLMAGYHGDAEETAALYRARKGWLATGDVGYLDADGFLTIIDRSKDMIISGGENIYPAEIEKALHDHPAVAECAVFGIPDERFGEVPAAHVVLTADGGATAEEIIDFCAARISRHKRPRLVAFADSLPKTAIGKIQKNALRAPYWEGRERKI